MEVGDTYPTGLLTAYSCKIGIVGGPVVSFLPHIHRELYATRLLIHLQYAQEAIGYAMCAVSVLETVQLYEQGQAALGRVGATVARNHSRQSAGDRCRRARAQTERRSDTCTSANPVPRSLIGDIEILDVRRGHRR